MTTEFLIKKNFYNVFDINVEVVDEGILNKIDISFKEDYDISPLVVELSDYVGLPLVIENNVITMFVPHIQYYIVLREVLCALYNYIQDNFKGSQDTEFLNNDFKLQELIICVNSQLIDYTIQKTPDTYLYNLGEYYGLFQLDDDLKTIHFDSLYKRELEYKVLNEDSVGRFLKAVIHYLNGEMPLSVFTLSVKIFENRVPLLENFEMKSLSKEIIRNILDLNLQDSNTHYLNTSLLKGNCYDDLLELIDLYTEIDNVLLQDITKCFAMLGIIELDVLDKLKIDLAY